MSYFKWAEEKIKKMTVWDVGILKICVLACALLIAKIWPAILSLEWYCYGSIFLVTYIYLIYKIYIKN